MPRRQSSRKDPLLEGEDAAVGSHRSRLEIEPGGDSPRPSSASSSSTIGCCGHFLIVSLPLVVCSLTLAILGCLIANFEDGTTIQNISVSGALELYEPYSTIVLLAAFIAIISFAVTASRNIQIAVSMQRKRQKNDLGSYSCFNRFLNVVSSVINVAAYIGFTLLIAFQLNQEEPAYAGQAHYSGAIMYFIGIAAYSTMHSILLYYQDPENYPKWLKAMFALVAVGILACVIAFGIDLQGNVEFEWMAVVMMSLYMGLFSILFHIDNVDDEL
ncbi:MAG: hypothetical protein SGARI_007981, partial [Bacillariaceae sp.]